MTETTRSTSLPGPTGNNKRECADNYRGELFRIEDIRVAVCRDGLQWLLQRRRPAVSPGEPAWETLGYDTRRNGLMQLHRHYTGQDAPQFAGLPEYITLAGADHDPERA
ncbi:hypothetical protein P1J78_21770 [Psychromarinibacter sp. C21-152]|uniref:Uncharacterized protein n=1 Tax=Psychromarinibacter sediminicola TaxID=3033385 RepID=A0AAE3TA62_9RHOB|nr:hypothetical protein [Psychromarinibacter sediminicola]MDF0603365.1 hypothetical protein [Psychromarinibacter sediminicola]